MLLFVPPCGAATDSGVTAAVVAVKVELYPQRALVLPAIVISGVTENALQLKAPSAPFVVFTDGLDKRSS